MLITITKKANKPKLKLLSPNVEEVIGSMEKSFIANSIVVAAAE